MSTAISRIKSGLEGLDHIMGGGFPAGRSMLVVGSSGSGKTLLSLECIYNQLKDFDKNCLFISFEESPEDIIKNSNSLNFDLQKYIDAEKLFFIDASPDPDIISEGNEYDLAGLLAQIQSYIKRRNVEFVVVDSLGALFFQYTNKGIIRKEIFRIVDELKKANVTSIVTAERLEEYGMTSRFGVEEFVTDGVIILRHNLYGEKLRRTIQIHKLRGGSHSQGEYPFCIHDAGVSLTPLSMYDLSQTSSMKRLSFGDKTFDSMMGGGLFNDSVVLISGPTGAGKTLLCSTFVAGGCENNERSLFFGFEESKPQLIRNAASWGYDFEKWEDDGLLKIESIYPEYQGLEEHLLRIRSIIEEFQPKRIVIDSVSALERIGKVSIFREFVIGLTAMVKQKNICSLFTSTSPKLSGGDSITDTHISTITDAIIILRYIERDSSLGRGLTVIKMRGSKHDKDFREFTIDGTGLNIGDKVKTGTKHHIIDDGSI